MFLEYPIIIEPIIKNIVQSHGTEGANLRASLKFTTSKDLRVSLVVSKSFEKDDKIPLQVKQRFPQEKDRIKVKEPKFCEASICIWYRDMKGS